MQRPCNDRVLAVLEAVNVEVVTAVPLPAVVDDPIRRLREQAIIDRAIDELENVWTVDDLGWVS